VGFRDISYKTNCDKLALGLQVWKAEYQIMRPNNRDVRNYAFGKFIAFFFTTSSMALKSSWGTVIPHEFPG